MAICTAKCPLLTQSGHRSLSGQAQPVRWPWSELLRAANETARLRHVGRQRCDVAFCFIRAAGSAGGGLSSGRSVNSEAPLRTPFLKALEGAGFIVGQNVVIDYRFAEGRDDRLSILAAELVQRQVTIVVATDRPSAVAAKAATNTIPLVFHSGDDPVRNGLVQSFNSPGGNATGISVLNNQLGPKRLSLLREIIPKPGVIAFVVNQNSTSTPT